MSLPPLFGGRVPSLSPSFERVMDGPIFLFLFFDACSLLPRMAKIDELASSFFFSSLLGSSTGRRGTLVPHFSSPLPFLQSELEEAIPSFLHLPSFSDRVLYVGPSSFFLFFCIPWPRRGLDRLAAASAPFLFLPFFLPPLLLKCPLK